MHTLHTIPGGNALVKRFLRCHTCRVAIVRTRKEITYPLSFRVPLSQVEEIDAAVEKERRKRRSDLLEAVWQVAWSEYRKSGSLAAFDEGKRTRKYSRRVSDELQDQLYTALETILERAPSTVIEEVARKLTQWAGKYGEEK
jgi:Arc/MetJ-type ribon-helix-helix transcriptional regulator